MDNKDVITLAERVTGLLACQVVLFQLLVKDGIIKREEIGYILDGINEGLSIQFPNNPNITKHIQDIRESINKASPLQFPDWLRDTIGGENQNKT